ncbi:MAG TPA: M56 family metallopeptidase [Terriglobales bacterium]
MSFSLNTHWIAAMAFERMLYCLVGGMALGAVIWVVLRLLPGKNSRTQFAVWFSTLLAVAVLPIIAFRQSWRSALSGGPVVSEHPLVTMSASWAEYIVLAWCAMAIAGLTRVAAGLWQLHRLRRSCVPIDGTLLTAASQARIADISQRRAVSVLVSSDVEVPTAIGFFHPAIVIPVWLADATSATELECVLLHELAHLRRWDDWSNLAQKVIKSILFFHPAVWWIERKLSLDREMACDDAVLEQTVSPRAYAECLARVAERRFLRRQMALAQAAVDRVKQLTRRVARILDADRAPSTRLWKPAIPMVLGVAALCAVSSWKTPELVRLTEPEPSKRPATEESVSSNLQIPLVKSADPIITARPQTDRTARAIPANRMRPAEALAWPASLKTDAGQGSLVPAKHGVLQPKTNPRLHASHAAPAQALSPFVLSKFDQPMMSSDDAETIVLVVATERTVSTRSGTWQFNTWEFRLVVPATHPVKPIPRKT